MQRYEGPKDKLNRHGGRFSLLDWELRAGGERGSNRTR